MPTSYDNISRLKVFYHPNGTQPNDGHRLVPAPTISLSPEYYYANDTIVGYTYNITLEGYAVSFDYRNVNLGTEVGFQETMVAIKNIKNLFRANGGSLLVTFHSGSDPMIGQSEILKAVGGIIKTISFEPNDNQWTNYARYRIELEFNEVQINECGGNFINLSGCESLPEFVTNSRSPQLIEMQNYRVKSLSENWSLNMNEADALASYDRLFDIQPENTKCAGDIRNQFVNIEYTVNAVGKHYYDIESGSTSEATQQFPLIPAWEQAKNYCQKRVYDKVNAFYMGVLYSLKGDQQRGCTEVNGTLQNMFNLNGPGTMVASFSGLNKDPEAPEDSAPIELYKIYNEEVSCNTSEADGSFSVTYKAMLKRVINTAEKRYVDDGTEEYLFDEDALYTFSLSESTDDDGKVINKTMSVQGTIQGLVLGGLVTAPAPITFPQNGKLLIAAVGTGAPTPSKFTNALAAYNKLANKKGLKSSAAQFFGITYDNLLVPQCCPIPADPVPTRAQSSSRADNYMDGSISFSATYTTLNAAQARNNSVTNVTITAQHNNPVIAEFTVPFRTNGPIIQTINVDSPLKATVTIEGMLPQRCCPQVTDSVSDLCSPGGFLPIFGIPDILDPASFYEHLITDEKFNTATDGSYSWSRTFIKCG